MTETWSEEIRERRRFGFGANWNRYSKRIESAPSSGDIELF